MLNLCLKFIVRVSKWKLKFIGGFAGSEISLKVLCVPFIFNLHPHRLPLLYIGNHVEDYRGIAATGKWYQQVQSRDRMPLQEKQPWQQGIHSALKCICHMKHSHAWLQRGHYNSSTPFNFDNNMFTVSWTVCCRCHFYPADRLFQET